jgi:demethylmenaquinone methyltransferase/2-methoxy-6-polyprenyl-1,4-benzoquinol methylase
VHLDFLVTLVCCAVSLMQLFALTAHIIAPPFLYCNYLQWRTEAVYRRGWRVLWFLFVLGYNVGDMSGRDSQNGNKAFYVRRMFADIARRYDLLNAILSFGFDSGWRRVAMAQIDDIPHESILDLAAGTGKIALLAAKRNPASTVVGVDFCPEMLAVARSSKQPSVNRVLLVQGDALQLPFPDSTFDCITIGFALRNVTSIASLFAEMARVTKPGGKMVSLELTRPSARVLEPLHKLYIKVVIRCVGGIISGKWDAYTYLPRSILEFPSPQEVQKVMEAAGWREVEIHRLTFGTATVQIGVKER